MAARHATVVVVRTTMPRSVPKPTPHIAPTGMGRRAPRCWLCRPAREKRLLFASPCFAPSRLERIRRARRGLVQRFVGGSPVLVIVTSDEGSSRFSSWRAARSCWPAMRIKTNTKTSASAQPKRPSNIQVMSIRGNEAVRVGDSRPQSGLDSNQSARGRKSHRFRRRFRANPLSYGSSHVESAEDCG